ncbi:hypothetical protein CASFOL_025823 [Castilleja foliolosa]|uniref:Protein kinase domain-containing protein n=1 Tax=Castilleja foliolosa TaxID=1961234 RepID=A0ABD3CUQ7_9LAMI
MFLTDKSNKMKDLTVADILKGTDNFNQANIIGCSGLGLLVFKVTLPDGSKLAIKKLSGNSGLMEQEFKAEVEALSTAQHKNILTLQGYCLHDGPSGLNWPARLNTCHHRIGWDITRGYV